MSLVFDIVLILIFAMCVFIGWKKGLIKSVINVLSFAAALFFSVQFYAKLADYLKTRVFFEKITKIISDAINSVIGNVEGITLDSLFKEKPQAFTDIIERFGGEINELESVYTDSVSAGVENAGQKVAEFLAGPIADTVSVVVAFALIFVVVLILMKIISIILDLIFKLPILKTINRVLGVLFGAGTGFLYISVISLLIALAIPEIAKIQPGLINQSTLDNSIILKFLYENNIFKMLFKNV